MPRVLRHLLLLPVIVLAGCWSAARRDVIVYSALDREFAEPVLNDFTKATGIRVLAKYDDESTKTVGLTNILIQEAGRPRCDVFWNNEILNTLRLEEKGLLAAYPSPAAKEYPEMYRSSAGTWHGFAARARILIVNASVVAESERPKSIYDLADARWKGKIGIARPITGTTATHVACLFAALGEEKAKAFFRSLKANDVQVLGGNKQVAQAAAAGQIDFGLTDTDDAIIEVERASSVAIVYPDRQPEQLGTLFIPNTVAIIKGRPDAEGAKKLVDFLLSPATETKLAHGASAQIPLNPQVEAQVRVETPKTVKAMAVDFAAAARAWDAALKFIEQEIFGQRQMTTDKVIGVLASGGLDSSILIGDLLRQGRRVQPFYIRTGLFWQSEELPALERFLGAIATNDLAKLVVLDLPLADLYDGHWSLTGAGTPDADSPDEAVFLPGRNALLIVKAAVWCQLHEIGELALAPLGTSPFGDAGNEFAKDFQAAINRGSPSPVRLLLPFAELHKQQVMGLGRGLPLELTFSCISPVGHVHCGRCNKCAERQAAFREVGMEDRTIYREESGFGVQGSAKPKHKI